MATPPPPPNDAARLTASFNNSAHTYDLRTGGATRLVASHIASTLPTPLPPHPLILDNACGTGALSDEILPRHPTAQIHAVDGSPGMIAIASAKPQFAGRVKTAVMDGQELGFADGVFDVSVTNFGIFFFPEPERGAGEIWRTLKVGGTAVVTAWKEPGLVGVFYACQEIVGPAVRIERLGVLERWREKGVVVGVLEGAGFGDVRVERFESWMGGGDEGGMVEGVVENLRGIVGGVWSEGEVALLPGAVERVLREGGKGLFVERDGRMGVPMVAWIATCTK